MITAAIEARIRLNDNDPMSHHMDDPALNICMASCAERHWSHLFHISVDVSQPSFWFRSPFRQTTSALAFFRSTARFLRLDLLCSLIRLRQRFLRQPEPSIRVSAVASLM
jgi:hypothetical protein